MLTPRSFPILATTTKLRTHTHTYTHTPPPALLQISHGRNQIELILIHGGPKIELPAVEKTEPQREGRHLQKNTICMQAKRPGSKHLKQLLSNWSVYFKVFSSIPAAAEGSRLNGQNKIFALHRYPPQPQP